jgi:hypothetical protein
VATSSAQGNGQAHTAPWTDRPEVRRDILPIPDVPHAGLTTYDAKDPDTSYPPIRDVRPPKGAPNVLVVLIDDVGFGASSAFGGPCQTPNFEKLASGGVKYTRLHTTALCSPTRQALLTGRNHHSVGMSSEESGLDQGQQDGRRVVRLVAELVGTGNGAAEHGGHEEVAPQQHAERLGPPQGFADLGAQGLRPAIEVADEPGDPVTHDLGLVAPPELGKTLRRSGDDAVER